LNTLSPLITGSIEERKCVCFLIQLYKLAKVPNFTDLNIETIIHEEETDTTNTPSEGAYLRKAAINCGYSKDYANTIAYSYCQVLEELFPLADEDKRLNLIRGMNSIHISTKNGPNGKSLLTAPIDWLAIRKDKGLVSSIIELSRLLKNKSLNIILTCFRLMHTKILSPYSEDNLLTSKLKTKVEPGGKLRVFAIGDWFSQSVLKGFHRYIFTILYSMSNDGTKSHSNLAEEIKKWTSDEEIRLSGIYSVDLTAATDLLSCLFQKEIVGRIAGKPFRKLWYTIMTKRKFAFKELSLSNVTYNKGQPMGLYSSWGMLALTHHIVCRTALKLSNITYDEKTIQFGIIGDDIALYGETFYQKYMLLMSELLKVPINPMKGFTPDTIDTCNPLGNTMTCVVEIAKRIFINGEEITSITPNSAMAGLERPEDFPSFLNELCSRGFLARLSTPRCITLAQLGFKPQMALELATFPPISALPFTTDGVANIGEIPEDYNEIPWVKNTISSDYLLIQLCIYLRVKLIPGIKKSLISILEYKNDRPSWSSAAYTYESTAYVYLLRLVNKEIVNRVNLVDVKTRGERLTFDVKDLRNLLDSIAIFTDMSLLMDDKSYDNKDTKRKTNCVIKKIIRSISIEVSQSYESKHVVDPGVIDLLLNSKLIRPNLMEVPSNSFVLTKIDDDIIDLDFTGDDYSQWDITIE